MYKTTFFLFLCSILINSCATIKQTPQEFWFDIVSERYLLEISKDNTLHISGSGGGMKGGENHDKINKFFFCFDCNKRADICIARRKTVAVIQKFNNVIENEINIHPYLIKYPFDRTTLGLILTFRQMEKKLNGKDVVHVVHFYKDLVDYCRWCPIQNKFTTIHIETYEEALKIYEGH